MYIMNGSSSKQRKQSLRRVPIVVIEPNADHWLIIRAALAHSFPEVTPLWINHTLQAKAYLASLPEQGPKWPRLILMDMYLPDRQTGLSLLAYIKTNPLYQAIPVIVLSESSKAEDVADAYSFNIASYTVKPTTYHGWVNYFHSFRRYWWELVGFLNPG